MPLRFGQFGGLLRRQHLSARSCTKASLSYSKGLGSILHMSSQAEEPSLKTRDGNINLHTGGPEMTKASPTEESQLALPAVGESASSEAAGTTINQTFKLDHLGPVVVNRDGTLSRINNWATMTELEQRNTLRVLGKRNMLRREKLESEQEGTIDKTK